MNILKILKSSLFLLLVSPAIFAQDYLQEAFYGQNASKVLVAAHRAAHNLAPENSLNAVENAIKEGIDIIEIDLRPSLDGVIMLMHDGTINRTTNGTGKLESYTFEDLRKFRLKNADGTLSESPIPTLEEVLKLAKGKILIDFDLKLDNIEPVVAEVQKASMQTQVFFFDSDYEVLKKVQKLDPSLYLMPRTHSSEEVEEAIRLFNPKIIHIDPSFYTKDLGDYLNGKNIKMWINALGLVDKTILDNNPAFLLKFLEKGANALQTDQPEKMLKALKLAGLHK